jgi:2-dehydro-3-deoxygluconokinase
MARIVCVGEAMLELSRPRDGNTAGDWRLGYGGDTINTAIHLARAGHDTAYLTALGGDPFSDDIKERWRAEGLDVSLVLTHPDRNIGLYAISTDDRGERSFTYWREASAARAMFALDGIDAALAEVERADLLYFSLITLAILPPEGRARLLALARRARRVAFDGNYRPRLWPNAEEARAARDAAIAVSDIGLPTLDDEAQLQSSPPQAGEDQVAAQWQALGCAETVVKLGAQGARLPDGRIIAPERALDPVDTSGAGDAFNAGYLSARLDGASIEAAARAGHALAGWTIMRPGAIPAAEPLGDS